MAISQIVYQKRTYSIKSFVQDSVRLCQSLLSLPAGRSTSRRLDRTFSERIMLAVTQVNQCRYCDYGHSIAALRAGVTQEELRALKSGDLAAAPPDELPALVFAQHYAVRRGVPDEEATRALINAYGDSKSRVIVLTIRMITLGNLLGNTFDAWLNRLRGRPVASGHALGEIGVLILALFTIPVLAITGLVGTVLRLMRFRAVSTRC